MRRLVISLGLAILSGCNSEQRLQSKIPTALNDKSIPINLELSSAWNHMTQGGAALRQPGYVHVLGDGNIGFSASKEESHFTATGKENALTENPADFNEVIHTFRLIKPVQGYSVYEMSRWERYCDSGKNMDEKDWRFIDRKNLKDVPSVLVSDCTPPLHTYSGYLNAWVNFCSQQNITDTDRRIVRYSVRPHSVSACKAM